MTSGLQSPLVCEPKAVADKRRWPVFLGVGLTLIFALQMFAGLESATRDDRLRAGETEANANVPPSDPKAPADAPDPDNGDAPPEGEAAAGDADPHVLVKTIPDIKAYVGSPDTHVELASFFADTEVAAHGAKLTYSVERNTKDENVEAVIDGDKLILKWLKIGKAEIRIRATNEAGDWVDAKFNAQVWVASAWTMAFTVIGGLGIFLLGMKNMSEGLQTVAGNGLRQMIAMVTNNRFLAVGAGAMATMVLQSSSITTVMVVGFVNSGFMMLQQAIGVIMGANIGTTITGWILVMKIGKYGLPLIGVCAFGYLFFRNENRRYLSMFGLGLGMVFFGLEIMKDGFGIIKDLPAFESWFRQFSAHDYPGVLKCAAVGCVLTFIVQSSSATLGITIGLASVNIIPFETAAALVLGENVGTTITAWLASLGATTNAKRAAYFHVLFNLIGVAWITAVFRWYLPCVEYVVRLMDNLEPGDAIDTTAAIAATHTGFNILNAVLFLPAVGLFARLLTRVVPQRGDKEIPHLTTLDMRLVETPVIAIEQSRYELAKMAEGCTKMMGWLKECHSSKKPSDAIVQKLFHREEVLDRIQDEVTAFMTRLLSANVSHSIIEEGRRQIRMADEYESVSDYIRSILKFQLKLSNQGHQFDEQQRKDILELHDLVDRHLTLVNQAFEERRSEVITKANTIGDEIKHRVKHLREQHLELLSEKRVEPFINVAYNATLSSYRRVRDHSLNVAELVAGEK